MISGRNKTLKVRDFILSWTTCAALLSSFGFATALAAPGKTERGNKHLAVLMQIHREVEDMGPYPGEDFIRRDFFVGEDDDDTNKDVHVIVLIQRLEQKETMSIRVTEMVKDPGNIHASLAGNSRILVCLVAGDRLEIQSSDYQEKELEKLTPEILAAVRNKKRLLKLNPCGSARPS